ncbi:MAG TPA: DUF58 domain-containing protein, partial [Planctomycetota bacterium]|nr:DUF58 domain-containing protein [Planctomycetota bacterium]
MSEVKLTGWGDEPETPRKVEWRLVIYPFALGVGAVAISSIRDNPLLFVALFPLFVVLMLAPIWIKWRAWGGLRRAMAWLLKSNLRITREGYVFVGLVILFGIAAINTGTNLLYLILAMLLSLMVMSTFLANMNLRGLRISRRVPAYVFAGEDVRIRTTVTNPRKRLPAFALEVRERSGPFGEAGGRAEGPPLFFFAVEPRGGKRTVPFTTKLPRRGVYPLEGFTISTKFPFGFAVQFARADLPAEVVAFPRPRELSGDAVRALGAADEVPRKSPFVQSPEEFRSLRDYRPRDNPRWIHWKSSARAGKLLVKEFEPRATRRAAVVIDPVVLLPPEAAAPSPDPRDTSPTRAASAAARREAERVLALDRGCTLAVSILEHLAREGERPEVAVLVKGEVARFGPDSGPREVAAILECLARLE